MLKDVVITQKTELKRTFTESYIERDQPFSMENNLIKVIMGPRRAGKSFFCLHTLSRFGNFGYVNLDDEALTKLEDYQDIVSEIKQVYKDPQTLFFDEIQNLPRWELFVNRLQRQGYNIVVTGSNSKLLSKELATHLTGRHIPTTVLTFSFKEYLKAKKADLDSLITQEREEMLLEYMRFWRLSRNHIKKTECHSIPKRTLRLDIV